MGNVGKVEHVVILFLDQFISDVVSNT
jgi:hypothetical protein